MCLFVLLLMLPLHCSLSQCLTLAMITVIIYYKSLSSRLLCHIHGGIINPSPTFMFLPHSNTFSSPRVPAGQSHNSLAWHSRPFVIGTQLPFMVLFLSTPFSRLKSSNHSELLAIPKAHFILYYLHLHSYCSLCSGMYSPHWYYVKISF